MSEITLKVDGMHCGGCESTVRTVLSSLENVESVEADHSIGEVRLRTSGPVDIDAVRSSIIDAGFELVA